SSAMSHPWCRGSSKPTRLVAQVEKGRGPAAPRPAPLNGGQAEGANSGPSGLNPTLYGPFLDETARSTVPRSQLAERKVSLPCQRLACPSSDSIAGRKGLLVGRVTLLPGKRVYSRANRPVRSTNRPFRRPTDFFGRSLSHSIDEQTCSGFK